MRKWKMDLATGQCEGCSGNETLGNEERNENLLSEMPENTNQIALFKCSNETNTLTI